VNDELLVQEQLLTTLRKTHDHVKLAAGVQVAARNALRHKERVWQELTQMLYRSYLSLDLDGAYDQHRLRIDFEESTVFAAGHHLVFEHFRVGKSFFLDVDHLAQFCPEPRPTIVHVDVVVRVVYQDLALLSQAQMTTRLRLEFL
jgi:hypothetical protein